MCLCTAATLKPVSQSDPIPSSTPEPADLEMRRQQLRQALAVHQSALEDAARSYVYALGMASDPIRVVELAREAVQEAAARALERAAEYQMDRSTYPWLRKFVFNAVRTLRSEKHTERKHLTLVLDTVTRHRQEDDEPTEDALLERLEADRQSHAQQMEWRQIFQLMLPEDRLVLEFYLDGYIGEALAQVLSQHLGRDIRRGAADTRLSRARTRLPEAYRAYRKLDL